MTLQPFTLVCLFFYLAIFAVFFHSAIHAITLLKETFQPYLHLTSVWTEVYHDHIYTTIRRQNSRECHWHSNTSSTWMKRWRRHSFLEQFAVTLVWWRSVSSSRWNETKNVIFEGKRAAESNSKRHAEANSHPASTLIMRICRVVCKLSSSMSSCLMFGLFIIILLGILQKLYVYIQHADMCLHKWPSVTFYLELRQVNLRFKLGWVTTESLQNQHTHTQTKKNLWENTTQLNFGHWEMSLIHRMSMLPPLDNHPSCHLTSGGRGGNMSLENTCKHLL